MTQANEALGSMMAGLEKLAEARRASAAMIAGVCEKHGEYTRGEAVFTSGGLVCPECHRLTLAALQRQERARRFADYSGVPRRFQRYRLGDFIPPVERAKVVADAIGRYAADFPAHLEAGRCLILCGRTGTGKTMLACAAARHIALEHGKICRYATAYTLVQNIKDTYGGSDDRSEREVVRGYVEPHLLIVDEVGVQYGSDTERLLLFQVLNGRYENVRPTVVISNEEPDGIAAYLGDRVVDRLHENGGAVLVFDWHSHRGRR